VRYSVPPPGPRLDEQWLRKQCETRSGPYLRPFSPNVTWRDAEVFLVGENPATPIRRGCMTFDKYWNSLTTNPADFAAAYSDARKERAGSADSSETSERRKTFERALGLNCLVTNVCSYPAFPGDDVPKEHRGAKGTGYEILSALLEMVQPRAILFHGAEAAKFARRKFKIKLDFMPCQRHKTPRRSRGTRVIRSYCSLPFTSAEHVVSEKMKWTDECSYSGTRSTRPCLCA
jgi:hypothetical protein